VRLASLFYEAVLLVPVLFISAWLFLALTRDASSPVMHRLFQLWLLLVLGLYFGYCWVKSGQTLAMKTWRLRLLRTDGAGITVRQAAVRFAVAVAGLGLVGAGFFWALFDRDRQFLHDRLAGTRIVRVLREVKTRGEKVKR
jgi:uncharacterized RDD family membrane protein YckC